MIKSLQVNLADKSYPIHFCPEATAALAAELTALSSQGRRIALITDRGVLAANAGLVGKVFQCVPQLVLEAGEQTKSLASFGRVLDFLAEQRLDRRGVLWVLGGGVIGDLGGFAAASYLRGIECVQVPTTLLAMVDSSVGGKTGINISAGKNLVGAFHHPRAVYVALEFLRTLPPREFAAGMAEVIKYGLLGDAALFARLEQTVLTADHAELPAVIRRCCEMKAGIVQADERETAAEGGRALLNLGHTFGHAIEQVTGYKAYLHGEAVAVGLAGAARLSQKLGLIQAGEVARIERVLAAHQLPAKLRSPLPVAELQAAMSHDKKNRADGVRFVVLNALGTAATRSGLPPALVEAVWRELDAV